MKKDLGYAAKSSISKLEPYEIDRRDPLEDNDVQIEILYCGVCHSDVHQVKNDWKNTVYPCMPGHEIVVRVTKIGSKVKKYNLGDLVGVGCMVDSCKQCDNCKKELEQYCEIGPILTYNGNAKNPSKENNTLGGFSSSIVVREEFVLRIPDNLDPAAACPLMCAGITTYSALKHWKVGPGMNIGIVGFGGLGHMATKIASALGADVTVITHSKNKIEDAKIKGAKRVVLSNDQIEINALKGSLDFILSTIPVPHDPNVYIKLLKTNGTMTIVGCLQPLKEPLDLSKMIPNRLSLGTSMIGGIAETQEVIDFCSKHNILPDIKVIAISEINDAFDSLTKSEVDYRYIIDMSTLQNDAKNKME